MFALAAIILGVSYPVLDNIFKVETGARRPSGPAILTCVGCFCLREEPHPEQGKTAIRHCATLAKTQPFHPNPQRSKHSPNPKKNPNPLTPSPSPSPRPKHYLNTSILDTTNRVLVERSAVLLWGIPRITQHLLGRHSSTMRYASLPPSFPPTLPHFQTHPFPLKAS
jgi:hypothetical protein